MHGYTKGEIASQLSVSLRTVETHRGPFDAKTGSPDSERNWSITPSRLASSISFDPLPPLTRRRRPSDGGQVANPAEPIIGDYRFALVLERKPSQFHPGAYVQFSKYLPKVEIDRMP